MTDSKFAQLVRKFAEGRLGSDYFLKNEGFLPTQNRTFRAFELIPDPSSVRVVIFGQDPYPNKDSACGIAFLDAKIRNFTDKAMAPSLKNILKVLLKHNGLEFSSMEQARVLFDKHLQKKFGSVQNWFEQLSTESGVLWLNTSLTFDNAQTTRKHTQFWQPVVQYVIKMVVKKSDHVVFVLMGDHAKKLQKLIPQDKENCRVVQTAHPVVEKFQNDDLFGQLQKAEMSIDGTYTDFLSARVVAQ